MADSFEHGSMNPPAEAPHSGLPQFDHEHDLNAFESDYSPAMNFQGTPLLSPHAMIPQNSVNPLATPRSQPIQRMRKTSTGKITKASPAMRWQRPEEEDFRLEDPAMSFALPPAQVVPAQQVVPTPQVGRSPGSQGVSPQSNDSAMSRRSSAQDELEERLQSAIQATSRASSTSRRASASSLRTTPRIRPKIGSSADASPALQHTPDEELFLKSNYHNLLEGTHHHLGLQSADQITTELRSKKAVHKLAEQERRNRMNVAITDLAKVLGPAPDDGKTVASKAATVERATEYIKSLKKRLEEYERQGFDHSN